MQQTTFLSLLYGAGIVMMLYFLIGELQAQRLRIQSLSTVIPSLQKNLTGPPVSSWKEDRPMEHTPRTDATVLESISSWLRDDPYPPLSPVLQPYDSSAGIPSPTVTEVGWWGA